MQHFKSFTISKAHKSLLATMKTFISLVTIALSLLLQRSAVVGFSPSTTGKLAQRTSSAPSTAAYSTTYTFFDHPHTSEYTMNELVPLMHRVQRLSSWTRRGLAVLNRLVLPCLSPLAVFAATKSLRGSLALLLGGTVLTFLMNRRSSSNKSSPSTLLQFQCQGYATPLPEAMGELLPLLWGGYSSGNFI